MLKRKESVKRTDKHRLHTHTHTCAHDLLVGDSLTERSSGAGCFDALACAPHSSDAGARFTASRLETLPSNTNLIICGAGEKKIIWREDS